ncbi:MAG: YqcI/YcgG family protein [Chitinophagales bacterium]|nr:YqcI/YcgG family protein [Chitinophagales bacterium]
MESNAIIEEYLSFLHYKEYPCIGAKAALSKEQIRYMVADNMACPKDDTSILKFLYEFIDEYRNSEQIYYSAAILFKDPEINNEEKFDELLWQRLQALGDLDIQNYSYDTRVSADPNSPDFSFSLKEEAFFIAGLHPASSRPARRFNYPAMVFNPHAQFEKMRETDLYEKVKNIIRHRDISYSGSINPMMNDYGDSSEASQYSGRNYDGTWKCPLRTRNVK